MPRTTWAAILALCLTACGEDIQPEPGPEQPSENEAPLPKIRHTVQDDGTVNTLVDATDAVQWVALDLDTRELGDFAQPAAWDVSFQRFHIRTRGGVNGTGGVMVAVLPDAFDTVSTAPDSGYREDAPDGDDSNTEPDNVFGMEDGWYSYDVSTHTLTPRARTYVVRSDAGRYYKLRMLGYYDTAGTPAMLSFRWKQVAPPLNPPTSTGATP